MRALPELPKGPISRPLGRALEGLIVGAAMNFPCAVPLPPPHTLPYALTDLSLFPVFVGSLGAAYGAGEVRYKTKGDVQSQAKSMFDAGLIGIGIGCMESMAYFSAHEAILSRAISFGALTLLSVFFGTITGLIGAGIYTLGRSGVTRIGTNTTPPRVS